MQSIIIIFTTIIVLIAGAIKECRTSQHSKYYLNNYGKTNNRFFISETYENNNPCEIIDNNKFRKLYSQYINSNVQVEHIIDLQNSEPELEYCNKNIRGNMILADGNWNQGVGQLCWDYVKMEKSQVYGNIFNDAYNNVKKCCGMGTIGSQILYAVIGICLTLAVVLIVLAGIWFYRKISGYEFDDGL